MNETEARTFREAHDAYAKRLTRTAKAQLANMYRLELADLGMTSVYGGPQSKDELISALMELRYPVATLNEGTHVLYHDVIWPDCQHCQAVATDV